MQAGRQPLEGNYRRFYKGECMSNDDRMKTAIQVQENLEKVCEGDPARKYDFENAVQVDWNDGKDRKIAIIPTEQRDGIGIFVYTDGLNTARIGLSTLAALYLHEGIEKVIIKDKRFLEVLKETKLDKQTTKV